jgi:hypothetical protein
MYMQTKQQIDTRRLVNITDIHIWNCQMDPVVCLGVLYVLYCTVCLESRLQCMNAMYIFVLLVCSNAIYLLDTMYALSLLACLHVCMYAYMRSKSALGCPRTIEHFNP